MRTFAKRLLACLLLLSAGASAQEVRDSVASLSEVMITATRNRKEAARLPYAVEVLDRERAGRQVSRTVPESLTGIPGVFVQKTNHGGGSPFVRGLTGNQTLLLVDGIRLNNSVFRYGPNQYMTLVDPFVVERVEVVKGSGSVTYGSDALTGVVNMRTATLGTGGKPEWTETLQARFTQSGMETTIRPELRHQGKCAAFVVGGGYKSFGDLRGGDTTGFQRPSGYGEGSFDAKGLLDIGGGWTLTALYHHLRQDGVPVYHRYVLENYAVQTSDPLVRDFGYLRLRREFEGRILREAEFFVSGQGLDETRHFRRNGSKMLRSERDRAATISAGADMLLQLSRRWTSNIGIEVYRDRVRSERTDTDLELGIYRELRGLYPDGSEYLNMAGYAMQHIDLGRLQMEGGLRYNRYRASIRDTTLGSVVIRPDAVVFQGGANLRLFDGLYVFAQASQGFRAPNIDDMGTLGIVDFRYEVPNFELRPEKSLNLESGVRYVGQAFKASASVFRTNLRDLITRIRTGAFMGGYEVYRKQNVDRGFIRGWELQCGFRVVKGLQAQASATYLYGQSLTRNEPLRRIPPFNARVSVDYSKDRLLAGMIYDHADPQRRLEAGDKSDNRIPQGGTPGFNILHAYAGYRTDRMILRMYLSNLFNQDYRTHGSGINGMGRAVSLSMTYAFRQSSRRSS